MKRIDWNRVLGFVILVVCSFVGWFLIIKAFKKLKAMVPEKSTPETFEELNNLPLVKDDIIIPVASGDWDALPTPIYIKPDPKEVDIYMSPPLIATDVLIKQPPVYGQELPIASFENKY